MLITCAKCDAQYKSSLRQCPYCGASRFRHNKPDNEYARSALTTSIIAAVFINTLPKLFIFFAEAGAVYLAAIASISLAIKTLYTAPEGIKKAKNENLYGRGMSIAAILISIAAILQSIVLSILVFLAER